MAETTKDLDDLDVMFLEHYGVLGMRWGVRTQDNGRKVKTGSSADETTGYKPNNPGRQSKARRKKQRKSNGKAKLGSYTRKSNGKAKLGSYTRKPKGTSNSSSKGMTSDGKAKLGSRSTSSDADRAATLRSKSLNEMSNDDINFLNNRLNLEANYERLTAKKPSGVQKLSSDILKEVGKETAKNALRSGSKTAGKYLTEKLKNG